MGPTPPQAMRALADKIRAYLSPESALEAEAGAALALEDRALNTARLRTWLLPLVVAQALVLRLVSRYPLHTALERRWWQNLMAIEWFNELSYVAAWVGVLALHRRPRAMDLLAPALFLCSFLSYAVMGINAQPVTGSVTWYMVSIAAAPYFLRVPLAWYAVSTSLSSALLVVGIAFTQPSPSVRAANMLCVACATMLMVVMAHTQRQTIVRDFSLRRLLERFNEELEARVEAQTRALRHFAQRLDEGLETERRRLARDLHDDLGQELTALRLEVEALRAHARDERTVAALARMSAGVDRSHQGVRAILESLRPRILDDEGLEAAMRWLARQLEGRTGCACDVEVVLYDEPDADLALVVFRVVQEAMTNVARHTRASRVAVSLTQADDALTLTVVDDGDTPDERLAPGRGLTGMHERVLGVGGTLDITPNTPRGTRVSAQLPLRHAPSPGATSNNF